MTVRVGLIGCGYWGSRLLRVFTGLPDVEIGCVVDSDARTRAQVPSAVALAADAAALWDDGAIDAAIIATPPSSHFELARAALNAGKHCWVEKPLALSLRDAGELVSLAERVRRRLFVDETFLYDPLIRTARDWISADRLGEVRHLSFERLGVGRIRRDSDVWWNSAPHDLSILRFLIPEQVESIHLERFCQVQENVADHCVATLRLSGAVSAHLYCSWLSPQKRASVVAVGERGMLRYEGRFGQRALSLFDWAVRRPNGASDNVVAIDAFSEGERLSGGAEEPLALAARAFVELVRDGVEAPSEARHSLRSVEILQRGEDGARAGTAN